MDEIVIDEDEVIGEGRVRGINSFGVGLREWDDWDVFVVVVVTLCVEDERDDVVDEDVGERGINSFGGRVGVNGLGVVFGDGGAIVGMGG